MECKKCGAPAIEGASFCGKCGARLDGKIACKVCGKLNLEEHDFCVYCGARIDGKTVCATCGNAHGESFCPYCGTAAKPAQAEKPAQTANKAGFKTVADIIANAAMLLGAVLSLIFVFFLGLKLQTAGEEETMNIFYYFGEYAKEIKDMHIDQMNTTPWFIDSVNSQLNAAGIIGIILSVAVLVTTATFAVIAIVKYSVGWAQGKHTNVEGWSLAAILCFLIGAVSLFAFNFATVDGDFGDFGSLLGGDSAGLICFNDETVTAIVLLAVCTVISVVFRMICEGKALWAKENIKKQTLTLIGVVIAAATFGISQGVSFAFSMETHGVSASVGGAFVQLSGGITLGMASGLSSTSAKGYYDFTNAVAVMDTFSIFAAIFTIALTVFSGLALMENVRGAAGKEDKSLLWSILAFASAVLVLVFSIICVSSVAEVFNIAQRISGVAEPENVILGNYTAPILAVVFTAVLFVLSLIKNKKSAPAAQNA